MDFFPFRWLGGPVGIVSDRGISYCEKRGVVWRYWEDIQFNLRRNGK